MSEIIITQEAEVAQALAQAYRRLLRCGERAQKAVEMPSYETAFIRDGCVFLAVEKGKTREWQAEFLAANGFELVGSENGFLLYSSHPNDDKEAWHIWEAAQAFLARE
jgi:predicted deacylase